MTPSPTVQLSKGDPVPWRCSRCRMQGLSEGRGNELMLSIQRFHDEVSPLCKEALISLPQRHDVAEELRQMGAQV